MTENLRFGPDYQPDRAQDPSRFLARGRVHGARSRCATARRSAASSRRARCARRSWRPRTRRTPPAAAPTRCATRWPANIFEPADLTSKETYEVMDLCLSCKACKTECPSSVDMAKLKTEFLAHYHEAHGTPLRAASSGTSTRSRGSARPFAPFANLALRTPLGAPVMRAVGVHPERKLSPFAARTLRQALEASMCERCRRTAPDARHRSSISTTPSPTYNYPRIGMAAVKLLEAAGFEVIVEERRACCGRPMLSKGLVDDARKSARRNVELLAPYAQAGHPDRRHRAELHPDPARRVSSICCPERRCRSWSPSRPS